MDHKILHKLVESMPAQVRAVKKSKKETYQMLRISELHVNIVKILLFTQVVSNKIVIVI